MILAVTLFIFKRYAGRLSIVISGSDGIINQAVA